MGRWHAQCHYRLYISLRGALLGKHSVQSWCFNYSSHCSPVQKHCCAEEDQQDTHPLNVSFLLAIQLPYSYLVSTAKSGDTDPPLALGKLGQEDHKVKASLGYETKTLSQRNENNLIKITAGWSCLSFPLHNWGNWAQSLSQRNAGGYSWSTCLSQPKVHVASPEASVFGSVPLCALPHLGHKGEPLTFAVYRAHPGTSLNAALNSAGVFSKHPGSRGGAGAVWTTHGTVRLYKSPSALLCFLTCHHLRLKRLLRL